MGYFHAINDPDSGSRASAVDRVRTKIRATPCRHCGKPSSFAMGGPGRRKCLCGACHAQAMARRDRLMRQLASLRAR